MMGPEPVDKKVIFEKRAVLVLAGVLVISLIWGLQQAGIWRPPSIEPRPVLKPPVEVAPSLPEQVERFRAKTESIKLETQSRPAAEAPFRPLYTANSLRNPLQEQLIDENAGGALLSPTGREVPAAAPIHPPTLVIQGLVWGGPKPTAIIDNQVYALGETIQGFTITDIGRDGITVALNGQTAQIAARSPEMTLTGPMLTPQERRR